MSGTIRDKAAIVGIGQTEFSKNSGRSASADDSAPSPSH